MSSLTKSETDLVASLSLSLVPGNVPFKLEGRENYFGPEDWAWQFLRMNRSYEAAYLEAKAQGKTRKKSERHFTDGSLHARLREPTRGILELEAICRSKFGASTWLDPKNKKLPKLVEDASWFFPLSMARPIFPGPWTPTISENIFSYGELPERSTRNQIVINHDSDDCPSALWFLIDCSKPIESQILGIRVYAKYYARWLQCKLPTAKKTNAEQRMLTLDNYLVQYGLNKSHRDVEDASSDTQTKDTVEWVIFLDVLGPIMKQLDGYAKDLAKGPLRLIQKSFLPRNPRTPSRRVGNLEVSDGNIYKSMVITAQLTKAGLDPFKIERLLWNHSGKKREKDDPWLPWIEEREARIRDYAKMSHDFIEEGYRWIVQAQKAC